MSHAESSVTLAENEHSHDPKAAVIDTGISSYLFCIMIFKILWISFSQSASHSSARALSRCPKHFSCCGFRSLTFVWVSLEIYF